MFRKKHLYQIILGFFFVLLVFFCSHSFITYIILRFLLNGVPHKKWNKRNRKSYSYSSEGCYEWVNHALPWLIRKKTLQTLQMHHAVSISITTYISICVYTQPLNSPASSSDTATLQYTTITNINSPIDSWSSPGSPLKILQLNYNGLGNQETQMFMDQHTIILIAGLQDRKGR